MDGLCPYCRRAGQLLKRLDLFGSLDIRSFRHDRSFERYGLTEDAVARELKVVVPAASGYRVFGGFEAVRALLRRIPPLWPLLPAAWLMAVSGQGASAYRWLAERRTIVPDTRACAVWTASSCRAHRRHQPATTSAVRAAPCSPQRGCCPMCVRPPRSLSWGNQCS